MQKMFLEGTAYLGLKKKQNTFKEQLKSLTGHGIHINFDQ